MSVDGFIVKDRHSRCRGDSAETRRGATINHTGTTHLLHLQSCMRCVLMFVDVCRGGTEANRQSQQTNHEYYPHPCMPDLS